MKITRAELEALRTTWLTQLPTMAALIVNIDNGYTDLEQAAADAWELIDCIYECGKVETGE